MNRRLSLLLFLPLLSSCWLLPEENIEEEETSDTRYYAEQNADKNVEFQNGESHVKIQARFDSLAQFFTTDTTLLKENIFIHKNWNGLCIRHENSLAIAVTSNGPVIFSCLPYYTHRLQPDSLVAISGNDRYTCKQATPLQFFRNRENFYIYYFREDETFAFLNGIRTHQNDSITVIGYNAGITSYTYELNDRDKEAISTAVGLCENYLYVYQ